jgi:uncharacterized protein with PIN domain
MRFLCDQNLGRLAKWLRIMGFDTTYTYSWDEHILEQAFSEERIVLTRIRKMARRKDCIVIKSDHVREQLLQVDRVLDLASKTTWFTRCNVCNETLVCAKPYDVKDRVPEYVYTTQEEFAQCPKCSRIYWKGTHLVNSMKTINDIIAPREES